MQQFIKLLELCLWNIHILWWALWTLKLILFIVPFKTNWMHISEFKYEHSSGYHYTSRNHYSCITQILVCCIFFKCLFLCIFSFLLWFLIPLELFKISIFQADFFWFLFLFKEYGWYDANFLTIVNNYLAWPIMSSLFIKIWSALQKDRYCPVVWVQSQSKHVC